MNTTLFILVGMTNRIIYENPPDNVMSKGRGATARRLAPLRNKPGEWARVLGPMTGEHNGEFNARAKASQIQSGGPYGIKRGEFEVKAGEMDGRWYIWARYVGDPDGGVAAQVTA